MIEGLLALGGHHRLVAAARTPFAVPDARARLVLIVGGTAALVEPVTGLFHESWAALLMALMIGMRRPGHAAGAIVAGDTRAADPRDALADDPCHGRARAARTALARSARLGQQRSLCSRVGTRHSRAAGRAGRHCPATSPHPAGMRCSASVCAAGVRRWCRARSRSRSLAIPVILLSLFGWASVATGWGLRVYPAAARLWRDARLVRPRRHFLLGVAGRALVAAPG